MFSSLWFYALLALAGITVLIFILGSKKNKKLSIMISKELERAINPTEKEYINIGGVIGYHGNFKREGNLYEVKTTFTFLPRHSIMFLPFSLLFNKHDRLYVLIFSKLPLRTEIHIIRKGLERSPNHKITNEKKLNRVEKLINRKKYYLYYKNLVGKEIGEKFIEKFDMNYVYHFAANPDNNNFYLYMIPVKTAIEKNVRVILDFGRELLKK